MQLLNTKTSYFVGNVIVCSKEIYIDTSTGFGFAQVFDTMKGYIYKLSFKYTNRYDGLEETKQEVCLNILEGILKYDPTKEASLSTFLYIYVSNKMIDKMRKNKLCYNTQLSLYNDNYFYGNPISEIELQERIGHWDNRWKNIVFRLFVLGDKICDIAEDEKMTPWGLSRAIRRKFNEARKV